MHSLNACCIVEWIEVQNISIYLLLFLLHAISGLLEARDRLYYTITLASLTSFEQDLGMISAPLFLRPGISGLLKALKHGLRHILGLALVATFDFWNSRIRLMLLVA